MKILSFNAWRSQNAELENELQKQFESQRNCEYCDGMGTHECDCGDTHDCHHCDGTGVYHGEGITSVEGELKIIYKRNRDREIDKISKWGVATNNQEVVEQVENPIEIQLSQESVR